MATRKNRNKSAQKKFTVEEYKMECFSCRKKHGKSSKAGVYCVDCNDYFCTNCVHMHRLIPSIADHTLVRSEEFIVGAKPKQDLIDTCATHPNLFIDMLCETHDRVLCNLCIKQDHRGCTVHYIPNYVKGKNYGEKLKEAEEQLRAKTEEIQGEIEKRQALRVKLNNDKVVAFEEMRDFKRRINGMFDDMEQRALQAVDIYCENAENEMAAKERDEQEQYDQLQEYETEMNKMLADGVEEGDPKLEELLAKMSNIIDTLQNSAAPPSVVEFQPNTEILDVLANTQTLGTLQIEMVNASAGGVSNTIGTDQAGVPHIDLDSIDD